MKRIIGIDLGTTNSLCATVFDEGPEVIGESENAVTPSVLSRIDSGWLVGQEAKEQSLETENLSWQIGMLIGMLGDKSDIPSLLKLLPKLEDNHQSTVWLGSKGRELFIFIVNCIDFVFDCTVRFLRSPNHSVTRLFEFFYFFRIIVCFFKVFKTLI